MSFPFDHFIEDERVPRTEVWFYARPSVEIVMPSGKTQLREPDAKIINIGEEKSEHDWIIAPH